MQPKSSYPLPELKDYIQRGRFGHVIDGVVERGDQSGGYLVLDPSSGRTITAISLGAPGDVDRAVASARQAFPGWSGRTPAQRADVLLSIADLLAEKAELISQLESMNVGKPLSTSRDEVPGAVDMFRFMAGAARTGRTAGADEYVEGHVSLIRRQALGADGDNSPQAPLISGRPTRAARR